MCANSYNGEAFLSFFSFGFLKLDNLVLITRAPSRLQRATYLVNGPRPFTATRPLSLSSLSMFNTVGRLQPR